jgi:hypothetical protein
LGGDLENNAIRLFRFLTQDSDCRILTGMTPTLAMTRGQARTRSAWARRPDVRD